ncbi:MAG: hypothetical protein JXA43_00010 [Candidatus Diapherotrites archaeon]|nr:hypothetical protein [Candidatus Diapherotrites archaeon]
MGKSYIPISWLSIQAFCEYQLKLQYVNNLKLAETPALRIGKYRHDALYKEFLKEATPMDRPFEE